MTTKVAPTETSVNLPERRLVEALDDCSLDGRVRATILERAPDPC